ncbi:MAG: hypothetical protein QM671_22795, partial [Bacillus sp. (in: firmicutes)]
MKIGRDKFKIAAIIPLHTAAITNIFSFRNGHNILLYSFIFFHDVPSTFRSKKKGMKPYGFIPFHKIRKLTIVSFLIFSGCGESLLHSLFLCLNL